MPKGPRDEKRPGDVIGAAVMVAKIATGEITEEAAVKSAATPAMAAGVTDKLWSVEDIVAMMDASETKSNRPKTYRKCAA